MLARSQLLGNPMAESHVTRESDMVQGEREREREREREKRERKEKSSHVPAANLFQVHMHNSEIHSLQLCVSGLWYGAVSLTRAPSIERGIACHSKWLSPSLTATRRLCLSASCHGETTIVHEPRLAALPRFALSFFLPGLCAWVVSSERGAEYSLRCH